MVAFEIFDTKSKGAMADSSISHVLRFEVVMLSAFFFFLFGQVVVIAFEGLSRVSCTLT